MPIYVYRCSTCEVTVEEIQKLGTDPPTEPSDHAACKKPGSCKLVRQLTTATHRFAADYSSDGIGGYQRQGDAMVRQVTGKNSTAYGSDRGGRD